MQAQVDKRLPNFCHLFPGHTPMNIPDMAYHQWEAMAASCDEHVEKNRKQARRTGSRASRRR